MLIDTHAHLDFPEFTADLDAVLERARQAGVTRILTVGTSLEGSRRAVALAHRHAGVYAIVGVHPAHAHETSPATMHALRDLAGDARVVAIGETGLDFHRLPAGPESARTIIVAAQTTLFTKHLELATDLGLNVVIHQRDAWAETLEILAPWTGRLRAVFHCFGGSIDQAQTVLAQGHLVSFTGIVTFKNAPAVHATARLVPDDAFMLETDCPYLAPVPFRGKRCEPAHVRLVAENIAQRRGITLEALARATMRTAETFFRLRRNA